MLRIANKAARIRALQITHKVLQPSVQAASITTKGKINNKTLSQVYGKRRFSSKDTDPAAEAAPEAAKEVKQEETAEEIPSEAYTKKMLKETELNEATPAAVTFKDPTNSSEIGQLFDEFLEERSQQPEFQHNLEVVNERITEIREQEVTAQDKNIRNLLKSSEQIRSVDISALRSSLQANLDAQKKRQLEFLAKKEAQVQDKAKSRVFQAVESSKSLEKEEKAVIEDHIKIREGSTAPTSEEEQDIRQRRFDILYKYYELDVGIPLETVLEKARVFNTLNKKEQLQVFETLKVYYNKEMAALEMSERNMLFDEKTTAATHAERVFLLNNAIKHIMPQTFNKEYMTVAQINEKKEQINSTFEKAKEWQMKQLDALEKTQKELNELEKIMTPAEKPMLPTPPMTFEPFQVTTEMQEDVSDTEMSPEEIEKLQEELEKEEDLEDTIHEPSMEKVEEEMMKYLATQNFDPNPPEIQPFKFNPKEFEKKSQMLQKIRNLIAEIPKEQITPNKIASEKKRVSVQTKTEEDQAQMANLMNLAASYMDIVEERMIRANEFEERAQEIINDESIADDQFFKYGGSHGANLNLSPASQRASLMEMLDEYDVNPDWLMSKKTSELERLAQETNAKYLKKASKMLDGFLIHQFNEISSVLHQMDQKDNMMLHKMAGRFQAFATSQFPKAFGTSPINSQEQILHELAVKQVQTMLDTTKKTTDFNPYAYLAERLHKIDEKKKQHRGFPATRTTFDAKPFQPYHLDDKIPDQKVLTFAEYKYLREKHIRELVKQSEEIDENGLSGTESEEAALEVESAQESMSESENDSDAEVAASGDENPRDAEFGGISQDEVLSSEELIDLNDISYMDKIRRDFGIAEVTPDNYWIMRINTLQRDAYLKIYNDYLQLKKLMAQGLEEDFIAPKGRAQILKKAVLNEESFFDLFRQMDKELFVPDFDKYPLLSIAVDKQNIIQNAKSLVNLQGELPFNNIPVLNYAELHQEWKEYHEERELKKIKEAPMGTEKVWPNALDSHLKGKIEYQEVIQHASDLVQVSKDHSEDMEPTEKKALDEFIQDLNEEAARFQELFGHSVFKGLPLVVDPYPFKNFLPNAEVEEVEEIPYPGFEEVGVDSDMVMIENELLAQIMDNLKNPQLYVPRVSNQVALGKDFEIEVKKHKGEQVFDFETYEEKIKGFQTLLHEKQKALLNKILSNESLATHNAYYRDQILFHVKQKESQVIPEEEDASEASGSESEGEMDSLEQVKAELWEAEKRILGIGEGVPNAEDMEMDMEGIEGYEPQQQQEEYIPKDEKLLNEFDIENMDDANPQALLMDILNGPHGNALDISGQMGQRFADVQSRYKKGYVPSADLKNEERAMDHMAFYMQPYDEHKIQSIVDLHREKKFAQKSALEIELDDTNSLNPVASASTEIEQVAKTQELDADAQKVANTYDPTNPLRDIYLRTKYQMYLNKHLRNQFAVNIMDGLQSYDEAKLQKQELTNFCQDAVQQYSTNIMSPIVYQFFNQDESEVAQTNIRDTLESIKAFQPNSQDAASYDSELRVLINNFKSKENQLEEAAFEKQVAFIEKQMEANKVKPSFSTLGYLAQKSMLLKESDKATMYLKQLVARKHQFSTSPIPKEVLSDYFSTCLSEDNFDGLAHLVNLLDHCKVNINGFEMSQFSSALDFYLNHTFDLNKLFTFMRFYHRFVKGSLAGSNASKQSQKFNVAFKDLEGIVDLNAVFSHLVEKTGSRTFVDPQTKVDPLYQMIDLFSSPQLQKIQYLSEEGTTFISHKEMANYFKNHSNEAVTLGRVVKALANFDLGNETAFHKHLLADLQAHKSEHKTLPKSYNAKAVSHEYIKMKAAAETGKRISENTAEVMLFLMKENELTAEAIDLCTNFHTMVGGFQNADESKESEIRNYYMSQTLLNMKLNKGSDYNTLLEKAVFAAKDDKSLAYLTSMTKAYLKDGSVDYALQFFHDGIEKRKGEQAKHEDLLLKTYEKVFGDGNLTPEQFKANYFGLMVVREQLNKEMAVIQQYDSILHNCQPAELESVFLLQTVLKEERSLLSQIAEHYTHEFHVVEDMYKKCENEIDVEHFFIHFCDDISLNEKEIEYTAHTKGLAALHELKTCFNRKNELEKILTHETRDRMYKVHGLSGEQTEIRLLNGVKSFDDALTLIGSTREEFEATQAYMEKRKEHHEILELIRQDMGSGVDVRETPEQMMKIFHQEVKSSVRAMELKEQKRATEELNQIGVDGDKAELADHFDDIYEPKTPVDDLIDHVTSLGHSDLSDGEIEAVQQYREWIQSDDLTMLPQDDIKVERTAMIDQAVNLNYNQLVDTIQRRAQDAMPMTLELFNKIQKQEAPKYFNHQLGLKVNDEVPHKADTHMIEEPNDYAHEFSSDSEEIDNEYDEDVDYHAHGVELNDEEKFAFDVMGVPEHIMDSDDLIPTSAFGLDGDPDTQTRIQLQKELGFIKADDVSINEVLAQVEYQLKDSTSPLMSNFMYLVDYEDGSELPDFEHFDTTQNFPELEQKLKSVILQGEKLNSLIADVEKMKSGLSDVTRSMKHMSEDMEDRFSAATKFDQLPKDERIKVSFNEKVDEMYSKYKQLGNSEAQEEGSLFGKIATREQKVQLINAAMGSHNLPVFTAFHAKDLISFGIENQVSEAVRLGEKMMHELDETLPASLAKATKEFKLTHAESYSTASRRTGPISFPKAQRGKSSQDSIVDLSDPYWQEVYKKNYRAQDHYKLPSIFAWDHEEYGVAGRVLDVKKMEAQARKMDDLF